MNIIKAIRPVSAWSLLVEKFLVKEPDMFKEGVGYSLTNSLFTYDTVLEIEEAKFDDEFDFGKMFGYTVTKWTGLITNYLDLDILDEARAIIRKLEENKAVNRNYHIGLHFADSHNNGKGCLVGGIFSRKIGVEKPELTLFIRTSDVVTRLAMDLLLFCRMGEYVYGHTDFKLVIHLKAAYADDTVILLYNNYKDIHEIMKTQCDDKERKRRIRKSFKKLMSSEEAVYKTYGHSFRAYKILRTDLSYKRPKPMLAKDLIIGDWEGIPLPDKCPSVLVRNTIKKTFNKFTEKYGLKFKLDQADKRRKLISMGSVGDEDSYEFDGIGDEDKDELEPNNQD